MIAEAVIGRDAELAAAASMLGAVPDGPVALLLEGEAGIGKTTLVRAAVADAEARGYRVLACAPSRAERLLSFAAMSDLLAGVPEDVFATLPAPQRHAVDVALLRAEPEGSPLDVRIVGAGFHSVLSVLAARGPVVVAIDDVQWIDAPSGRVLEFAFRRLGGSLPVGTMTASRTPDHVGIPLGLDRTLPDPRRHRLEIGPLSLATLHEVLRRQLGESFPRPVLVRIADTSQGNPFHALEIARAVLRAGQSLVSTDALPVSQSLQHMVRQRIDPLPAATREALLFVAAASRPTPTLIRRLVTSSAPADVLAPTQQRALIEIAGGHIRFCHPLLGAAVYGASSDADRRQIHRRLAAAVDNVEEHARHLALASDGASEEVAGVLEQAARRAEARGAADTAAELMHHARLLTPPERVQDFHRRGVAEGQLLYVTGDAAGASRLLSAAADALAPGTVRADALWKLGNVQANERDVSAGRLTLTQALDDAEGHPGLQAAIERDLTYVSMMVGDVPAAALHGRRAAQLAEGTGDRALLNEALAGQAWGEFLSGFGVRHDLLARACLDSRATAHVLPSRRPAHIYATLLVWADDLDGARERFAAEYRRVRESGVDAHLLHLLWQMSELETLAGNYALAECYANEGYEAAVLTGEPNARCTVLYAKALVDAHLGRADRSRAEGEEARALAMSGTQVAFFGKSLYALGFLELSLGNPAGAHAHLAPLTAIAEASGTRDSSPCHFMPEAVEALVALDRLDEAAALLHPFAAQMEALGRGWGIAAAARCRGMLAAARGDLAGALAAVEAAVARHRELPYPLELGRSLLVKGQVHRRAKARRVARDVLAEALDIFERLGAALWAEKARAELGRVGLRPAARDDLTATEERVAELAATGLTNREIARVAFLSPKSVEALLGRVYAKLGIRSRGGLGAAMERRRVERSGSSPRAGDR